MSSSFFLFCFVVLKDTVDKSEVLVGVFSWWRTGDSKGHMQQTSMQQTFMQQSSMQQTFMQQSFPELVAERHTH